jgi:hypothetical protein
MGQAVVAKDIRKAALGRGFQLKQSLPRTGQESNKSADGFELAPDLKLNIISQVPWIEAKHFWQLFASVQCHSALLT